MTEAEQERAAIVAWLRAQADWCAEQIRVERQGTQEWLSLREQIETFHVAADAIEAREHLERKP